MTDIDIIKPVIFIDQKKHRIRIHKCTLRQLGYPKFIQILINPDILTVIIRCAEQSDKLTHRIIRKNCNDNQSYELYSRYLIEKLQNVCTGWTNNDSYRICGEIIVSENIACFDLHKAVSICFGRTV